MNKALYRGATTSLFFAIFAIFAIQSAWGDTASVTVNTTSVDATVPVQGYGMNTAVFDNDLIDSTLPGLMSTDGITALRFPGGSYSDLYHWATNSGTAGSGIYINSNDTFQNWMNSLVLPLGAHPIITVNYGSNAAGTGGGDPTEAAAWVKYANVTNNDNITYWEIGNEVYGNGEYGSKWEEDLHPSLTPTTYGTNALAYISDMKAAAPTVKVGVVLTTYGDWPDGQSPNWNAGVLQACGSKIDFVILHWYPDGSLPTTSSGIATALTYPATIPTIVAQTRSEINQYCGSNAPNVQILVTETNDVYTGQTDCSMFEADDYLSWFEGGIQNVDWWNLHQTYLSNGVSGVPNNTQDSAYWGIKMATLTARPGDDLVASSSNNSLLRVHATRRTDGSVGLLLMNENPNSSNTVSVSVSGTTLSTTGTEYTFGPSQFGSNQYTTNGPIASSISGVGNNFTVTVPAYTEEALIIPAGSPSFTMSASGSPASLAVGATTTIIAYPTDTGAPSSANVQVQVLNSSGTAVVTQNFSTSFSAGQTVPLQFNWTPSTAGTYTLAGGVFNQNFSTLYGWYSNMGTITVTGGDTAEYNFESGVQGWTTGGVPITSVAASTTQKFAGAQSLAVNFSGAAGSSTVFVSAPGTQAGKLVVFHVWVPVGSKLTAVQPYVMDKNWTWTGSYQPIGSLTAGAWNTISLTVPSNAVMPLQQMGVSFATSATWTGTCYIDNIYW